MSTQTPGCGTNTNAAKRIRENAAAPEPTTNTEALLLRVLGEHSWGLSARGVVCSCDAALISRYLSRTPTLDDHRAHVAAVLTDALVDARRAEVAERRGTFCEKCGAIVTHPSAHLKGGLNPGWRCPAGGVA